VGVIPAAGDHRRIFEVPTPLADAFNFVEATCRQPHHLVIGPGARHLPVLRRLCEEADALGDLVPDAVIAAVALEHGCQVATLDRDFARFSSIRHLRPGYASPQRREKRRHDHQRAGGQAGRPG